MLIGISDQRRNIGDTIAVEGLHAWRIVGTAIVDCQVLQPVEVAAEGVIVRAEPPVATPPVNENHGEGLFRVEPRSGYIDLTIAQCQRLILLLPAHAKRNVGTLDPPLGDFIAAVDIAHFLIVDRLESAVVVALDDSLFRKELVFEGFQRAVSRAGAAGERQNGHNCSDNDEMNCGHLHVNASLAASEACYRTPGNAHLLQIYSAKPAASRFRAISGKICLIRKRDIKCGDFGVRRDPARPPAL